MAKDGVSNDLKKKIKGYNNAINAAEYEAALEQYYTNKRNEEVIADLKDKSALRQWKENEKIRQLKIANATDQFDKSHQTYETTLDAIDLASRDAKDRVKLGLDEQIAQFAYEYDDLERDMHKASMEAGLQYDQKEQSLEQARITDMVSQENINIDRALKNTEYTDELLQNSINENNVDEDLKQNKLQIKNQDEDLSQNNLQIKNLQEDLGQNNLQIKNLQEDINQNDNQGKNLAESVIQKNISKKQNLVAYRDNQIKLTLENIKARGSARSRGQQGKSVQRAVQTSVALEGINQKTLSDNLYYSQKTIDSQRSQILNDKESNTSKKRQIQNNSSSAQSRGRQIQNNSSSAQSRGRQIGNTRQSSESQGRQLQNRKDSLKSTRTTISAKKKADLGDGTYDPTKSGSYTAAGARAAGGRLGLNLTGERKKSDSSKKGFKREQDYISESLGITSEEFDMSREKLAESLQSASASATLKLKNIETKKFEAQGQAYAQKMVRPRFGDAQPMPFKTPLSDYVMPKPAPETPMMNGNMGRGVSRPASGASAALGIGSSALGVGAAIAGTGAAAPFLAAGAGILGGLSKLFG